MDRKTKINIWYIVVALAGFMLVQSFYQQSKQYTTIPYSRFQTLLDQDKIDQVWIAQNTIEGTLKQPEKDGLKQFVTTRVAPDLASELNKHHVTYTGEIPSTWLTDLLSWVLPAVIFFGLWMFVIRRFGQGAGGLMAIGKSRARIYVETDTKVTFADVAGVEEAKAELKEVVEFLKDPKGYSRLGAHIPNGVLLVGPPGTGKTLLARAVAGEAGVKFFSISGSEFVEMFVGVGAARVRDLFEQARQQAPAIIFIDELDALGGARGAFVYGGNSEKEQTLNQLLVEMDGFDPSIGVILLAATNRPEILDPALLRAGRFDRQVLVDRPDKKDRIAILEVHLKKAVLASDVNPEQVAELTVRADQVQVDVEYGDALPHVVERGLQDLAVEMQRGMGVVEQFQRGLGRHRALAEQQRHHHPRGGGADRGGDQVLGMLQQLEIRGHPGLEPHVAPCREGFERMLRSLRAEILRHRALDVVHGHGRAPAAEGGRDRGQRVGHEQIGLDELDRGGLACQRQEDVGQHVERQRPSDARDIPGCRHQSLARGRPVQCGQFDTRPASG